MISETTTRTPAAAPAANKPVHGINIHIQQPGLPGTTKHTGNFVWFEPGTIDGMGGGSRDYSTPVNHWKRFTFPPVKDVTFDGEEHRGPSRTQTGTDPAEQRFRKTIMESGLLDQPKAPYDPAKKLALDLQVWHQPLPQGGGEPMPDVSRYVMHQGETPSPALAKVLSGYERYISDITGDAKLAARLLMRR